MAIAFPKAKINIGLYVTEKRTDGYHNLCSCFYPIPFYDVLEILPAPNYSLHISGLNVPGAPEDNLCTKAFRLMQQKHGIDEVAIYLHKHIPMGAGLGGGSSDAAATLKLLNELFDLKLPTAILKEYAAALGSDCAFFIEEQAAICTGRGEICHPLPLSLYGYHLVVVYPEIHISTANAYRHIQPAPVGYDLERFLCTHEPEAWGTVVVNRFEDYVLELYPDLALLKKQLYEAGACYASMTGSGSAFYGIFKKPLTDYQWSYPTWQFAIQND